MGLRLGLNKFEKGFPSIREEAASRQLPVVKPPRLTVNPTPKIFAVQGGTWEFQTIGWGWILMTRHSNKAPELSATATLNPKPLNPKPLNPKP